MAEISLEEMANRWAQVDILREMPAIVIATHEVPENMIRQQHALGKLSTGQSIAPSYADKYYAKKKNTLNLLPGYGVPDIYSTGQYAQQLQITVTPETYTIDSSVSYADSKNIQQYGENLNRLSDENKSVYSNGAIKDAIIEYLQKTTGADFQ